MGIDLGSPGNRQDICIGDATESTEGFEGWSIPEPQLMR
jgi:hypothetical protein